MRARTLLENVAMPAVQVDSRGRSSRSIPTSRRGQMFDMLRQVIDKYNQTAKGMIDGLGR